MVGWIPPQLLIGDGREEPRMTLIPDLALSSERRPGNDHAPGARGRHHRHQKRRHAAANAEDLARSMAPRFQKKVGWDLVAKCDAFHKKRAEGSERGAAAAPPAAAAAAPAPAPRPPPRARKNAPDRAADEQAVADACAHGSSRQPDRCARAAQCCRAATRRIARRAGAAGAARPLMRRQPGPVAAAAGSQPQKSPPREKRDRPHKPRPTER